MSLNNTTTYMGLTWEEVKASAQHRHSWRQRVAVSIGDAGWIKVKVKVTTYMMP